MTDKKVVLLIDFGKFNTEDNDLILQPKTKIIIGFTSASGEFISIQKVLYDGTVERVILKQKHF